jgi:hypothetical protein
MYYSERRDLRYPAAYILRVTFIEEPFGEPQGGQGIAQILRIPQEGL